MTWAELLAAAEGIRTEAAADDASLGELPIAAIGWATVEADRAFEDLAGLLGGTARWVAQERDHLLGASAWRRDPSPDVDIDLVVLEPDTEGRLAAFLARFGEGVGAAFVSAASGRVDRCVAVNPRWGPYVIVRGVAG